jgi:hypothetical protein
VRRGFQHLSNLPKGKEWWRLGRWINYPILVLFHVLSLGLIVFGDVGGGDAVLHAVVFVIVRQFFGRFLWRWG